MGEIAFVGPITFIDYVSKTFKNDKGYFTVNELVQNVVEFEKVNRPKTDWFGEIDTHHTKYFF